MDTPDGNGTGILQAAPEGNQKAAVRKLAQARLAHLPPVQRRWLGSGGAGAGRRLASHPLPRQQPPRGIAPARLFSRTPSRFG
jgi:hypothetical protein